MMSREGTTSCGLELATSTEGSECLRTLGFETVVGVLDEISGWASCGRTGAVALATWAGAEDLEDPMPAFGACANHTEPATTAVVAATLAQRNIDQT